jgi:hypothetical protein
MDLSNKQIRVLMLGCGNMGASHAKAYELTEGFEICGLVSTGTSKEKLNQELNGNYPLFTDFEEALSGFTCYFCHPGDGVWLSCFSGKANCSHAQGCHAGS